MYGATIGSLTLNLMTDQGNSTLVTYDTSRGDEWYVSTQYIGYVGKFQIGFTYINLAGNSSNAALDDIRFVNCNPRIKPRVCSPGKNERRCVFSGECVSLEKVCDGARDCVDGSDEDASICDFLPGHCDFENGLCGYSQGLNDNFDWLLDTGGTVSILTGPAYDHTFGTKTGECACVQYSVQKGIKYENAWDNRELTNSRQ